MQMEDQRSEQKAKLQEVMSSTKASATEKNKGKKILMPLRQWKRSKNYLRQ